MFSFVSVTSSATFSSFSTEAFSGSTTSVSSELSNVTISFGVVSPPLIADLIKTKEFFGPGIFPLTKI